MDNTPSTTVNESQPHMRENISHTYPRQSKTSELKNSKHSDYIYYNERARGTYGSSFLYCVSPTPNPSESIIEILELSHITVREVESWIKNLKSLVAEQSIVQIVYFMAKLGQESILKRGHFNYTFPIHGLKTTTQNVLEILSKPISRTELCWVLIDRNVRGKRVVVIEYVSLSYERTRVDATYSYLQWTIEDKQINVQRIHYTIDEEKVSEYEYEQQSLDETLKVSDISDADTTRSDRIEPDNEEYAPYNLNKDTRKSNVLIELDLAHTAAPHVPSTLRIEHKPAHSQLSQLAMVDYRLRMIMNA